MSRIRILTGRLVAICLVVLCLQALGAPVVVGIADMCMETNRVSILSTYADAFARAGNTPLVLPAETNREVVARMLASVDVLLLCGGEDVDPSRYKTKPSPRLGEVNLRRDAWEWLLLDEAVKRHLPVIGICRGCQLINVYFGGTLWQDLPSERPGEVKHRHACVVVGREHRGAGRKCLERVQKRSLRIRRVQPRRPAVESRELLFECPEPFAFPWASQPPNTQKRTIAARIDVAGDGISDLRAVAHDIFRVRRTRRCFVWVERNYRGQGK